MGHIKEPNGVDFFVDPTPLTTEDRQQISQQITYYKQTGKKLRTPKAASRKSVTLKKKTALA